VGRKLLEVRDLAIEFPFRKTASKAINGVSFTVHEGESIGIVGESGCGKTISCYAAMSLLPPGARITRGEILIYKTDGEIVNVVQEDSYSPKMRNIRGSDLSIIFQEPNAALSPLYTMADQIIEAIQVHNQVDKAEARQQAVELFQRVGIPNPEKRIDEYPFQFSGGMIQRAMIAMALASKPRLLIADEPTTALDVTIQAQVLMLIRKMQQEFGISLILVTHNLGIVAHLVDRIYVMYLGRVVEEGPVAEIFDHPKHPYTQGLLRSIPKISGPRERLEAIAGTVPTGFDIPPGCAFHPRCKHFMKNKCDVSIPEMYAVGSEHRASCFLYEEEEVTSGESIIR
jgi:peptide/nickel transport system ATP-binding protein